MLKEDSGLGGEKLDHIDVLGLLKEWELEQVRLERIFDELKKIFGCIPECELFEAMWGNFRKYTEMLERVLGDKNGTLVWYWLENKMGKGGLKAGVNGAMRSMEGLKDLAWLFETGSGGE